MPVLRFDRSELRKPTRTREGWLRADGYLTRTGVFEYRLGDGTVRRELRLPEEVFHDDALQSFALAPLTREHPPGAVTAKNWRTVAVGTVGENVRKDGDFVRATLLITDPDAVLELEKGQRAELSCGYTCELEEKSGVWKDNGGAELHYDCVQRGIRGNHVALVQKGRAGPEVRVRLDAADGLDATLLAATDDAPPRGKEGGATVVKRRIDGIEAEVSEQAAQLLDKQERERGVAQEQAAAALKTAQEAAAKEKGRADALDAKVRELEKAKQDAEDPKRIQELVTARAALLAQAAPVLGDKVKLDSMDDAAIRAAVVAKLVSGWKSDGKPEAEVRGAYETAIALAKRPGMTPLQSARGALHEAGRQDAGSDDPLTAARERMKKDAAEAWKPKASAA